MSQSSAVNGHPPLARTLVLSCHPAPTVGVTAFSAVLGMLAGCSVPTVVLLAAAVLSGQLSIGWSNDRIDATRDASVGRRDKPVAAGSVPVRIVDTAITAALIATILLSLSLGLRAGLTHLMAVGAGWAYNLGAKGTPLSWFPYVVAFGALPAVATLAAPGGRTPAGWLIAAGGCLGVVAHLANVLPDLVEDRRTGVRGAPHRLGAERSVLLCSALLLAAILLVVVGPQGNPGAAAYTGLGLALTLSLAGTGWAWHHPSSRATFLGLFGYVALLLALLASTSHQLR